MGDYFEMLQNLEKNSLKECDQIKMDDDKKATNLDEFWLKNALNRDKIQWENVKKQKERQQKAIFTYVNNLEPNCEKVTVKQ